MRILSLLLSLFFFQYTYAQFDPGSRAHGGMGLAAGSLNFQQNGAGSLAIHYYYNLLSGDRSSFSIGTNLKVGSEDINGISFPAILGLLIAGGASGSSPDLSNSDLSNRIRFFGDFPLLLHYNWGLGAGKGTQGRFGFYLGGGMSYTVTGVTNSDGNERGVDFFGWMMDLGVRFARNKELGVSTTIPFSNPIGPIYNPILYQLSFIVLLR